MSQAIGGLWAACATPVSAAGLINHDALTRHAARLLDQGCDGLVLFGTSGEGPSFYFAGAPAQGIEDAFAAVLDSVADDRLRVCLYHIPQVCGVGVPPEVLGRLRRRYGAIVCGVKDSSGDFAS